MDVIARCPTCNWIENPGYASDGRCRGVPHPHPVAWLEQVEVVPAEQLRGAVDDLGVALDLLARARSTDLGTDAKSWWRAERLRLTAKWEQ